MSRKHQVLVLEAADKWLAELEWQHLQERGKRKKQLNKATRKLRTAVTAEGDRLARKRAKLELKKQRKRSQ